ncbi:MAG: hypothetical protein IT245_09110 [Bacteroidia bacterium]|nr:hypothetical protein [Bacteroidia bacterium]
MKSKNILITCIVLCTIQLSEAQNNQDSTQNTSKENPRWDNIKKRLVYNMGGSFWISNSFTNIGLMPQLGYKLKPNLTVGVGLNFQYFNDLNANIDPVMIYGGNVFSRYMINPFFLQAEYQVLQYRENLGGYGLIGGGYLPSSKGLYVSAYYILHQTGNSAYGSTPYIIRVGFLF